MTERWTAAQFKAKKPKAKRVDREGPVQRDIVGYLRKVFADGIVHHCKNEIKKRGWSIAKELAQAKIDGVVTGFPDIIAISYAHVPIMFFEVKAEGGRVSPAQAKVHAHLRTLGHRIAVVRSVADVKECLTEWGIPYLHLEAIKPAKEA